MRKGANRYPPVLEKGKCRGCGEPVPKGRQTWCSTECFESHDPGTARMKCKQRDKGVCAMCGVDTQRMKHRCPPLYQGPQVDQCHKRFRPNGINSPFNRERYDRALAIRNKHFKKWKLAAEKRRATMVKSGWPHSPSRHWWEADHIIPHSEGGTYAIDNMRTLCVPCHKARTKAWHKSRKAIKSAEQIELLNA